MPLPPQGISQRSKVIILPTSAISVQNAGKSILKNLKPTGMHCVGPIRVQSTNKKNALEPGGVHYVERACSMGIWQGVTKRRRLSWLINSVLVHEPKCGWIGAGEEGVRDSANDYSCKYGAQINVGDLTPYLTCSIW
jgi:hypothetical protein